MKREWEREEEDYASREEEKKKRRQARREKQRSRYGDLPEDYSSNDPYRDRWE